jgi:hypothetical protein
VSPPVTVESTQVAERRGAVSDEAKIPRRRVSPSNRCRANSGDAPCSGAGVVHGASSKVDPGAWGTGSDTSNPLLVDASWSAGSCGPKLAAESWLAGRALVRGSAT